MREVGFTNFRGLRLAGILHEGAGYTGIIIAHGFRGNKDGSGRAVELGEQLSRLGYHVLRFDFSGCGKSEGDFADLTLSNNMEDLSAAISLMQDLNVTNVVVLGRSFGGTTAICQAARDDRIKGVCTWAAPMDLQETFGKYIPGGLHGLNPDEVLWFGDEGGPFPLKARFFTEVVAHRPLNDIKKIKPRPLLLVHGDMDEVVSLNHSRMAFEAAGEPKELVVVASADHQFTKHQEQVWGIFIEWLSRYFPNKG